MTTNIKQTLTFQMVDEAAQELSIKLQKTLYVIHKKDSICSSLHTCESIEKGELLSIWENGNLIAIN